jgi:16S rRNA (adenine1518-N6/adenine1519-N6)-dimethyltransferase
MLSIRPTHTKKFGQHFLHDKNYIKRIIAAASIQPTDCLIEIGPGGGALTEHLLPLVHRLVAIEVDRVLCQSLIAKFGVSNSRFCLYEADALQFDFSKLACPQSGTMRLIGNLPYNIATPLLFYLIKYRHDIQDFHVMLQKEVADRVVAVPGDKAYGRLSVMLQYYCQVERLFRVSAGAFYPPPKVESAMVRITPWKVLPNPVKDEALLARVVKNAFNQRRKIITNSLRELEIGSAFLTQCGITVTARAEQLTVGDYARLANAFGAS